MFRLRSANIIMLVTPLACTSKIGPNSAEQRSTAANQETTVDVPETCLVTKPSGQPFVPPSPYPTQPSKGTFWFGTDHLWTALPADGTRKGCHTTRQARRRSSVAVVSRCTTAQSKNVLSGKPESVTVSW
jgi:hypothetical protein